MSRLSRRERALLSAAGLALGFLAAWYGALHPALDLRRDSLARLARTDAVAALLDRVPADLAEGPAAELAPLRQRVTDAARRADLGLRRLDPQGSALSVRVDDVAFAVLIRWLEDLTGPQGVRVLAAEIGRRPVPGRVSAHLVLEAAQ
ncbi:MAG: type II secretion system protein GspM [Marinibacterium sp.]